MGEEFLRIKQAYSVFLENLQCGHETCKISYNGFKSAISRKPKNAGVLDYTWDSLPSETHFFCVGRKKKQVLYRVFEKQNLINFSKNYCLNRIYSRPLGLKKKASKKLE